MGQNGHAGHAVCPADSRAACPGRLRTERPSLRLALSGSLPVTRLALPGQEEPICMKRTSLRPRTILALGLCVPLTVVLATGAVGAAAATRPASATRSAQAVHLAPSTRPASAGHGHAHGLVPRHVYAPYFET